MQVRIKHRRTEDASVTGALLASFPNGAPPASVLHNDEGAIEFACYANGSSERELLGSTPTLNFQGATPLVVEPSQARYMIGLYDSSKGELQLVDPGPIFAMNRSLKREIKQKKELQEFMDQTLTAQEARLRLLDTFGSRKAQVARRKKLGTTLAAENEESVDAISAALENQSKRIVALPDENEAETGRNALAPACDLNAETADEVYRMDALLPDDKFQLVHPRPIFDAIKTGAPKEMPAFIADNLTSVTIVEHEHRIAVARVLMYTWLLMRLRSVKVFDRPFKSIARELNCGDDMVHFLVGKFFDEVNQGGRISYSLSKAGADALLLQICVFALHIANFTLIINQLANDLSLPAQKLASYFQELGCRVTRPNIKRAAEGEAKDDKLPPGSVQVSLQLPLVFPKARGERKDKRR